MEQQMNLSNVLRRYVALPGLIIVQIFLLNMIMKAEISKQDTLAPSPKITLAFAVEAHRAQIAQTKAVSFAARCLAQFPHVFTRAEELTGVEASIIAGIAGYESAGCTQPKDGPGNIMHIVYPSDRHLTEAARLIGIPEKTLDYHKHSGHSAMVAAVMLRDYMKRTGGSLATGLSAYRHGPSKASYAQTGDAYTRTVMAHIVLARRVLLSKDADIPFAPESSIDEMEIPASWWMVARSKEVPDTMVAER